MGGKSGGERGSYRYVEGEQRLGRVPTDAGGAMLALALAGTVHHLLMHGSPQPGGNARLVRRLVTALVPTANGLGASA